MMAVPAAPRGRTRWLVWFFLAGMCLQERPASANSEPLWRLATEALDSWQLRDAEHLIKAAWYAQPDSRAWQLLAAEALFERGQDSVAEALIDGGSETVSPTRDASLTEALTRVDWLAPRIAAAARQERSCEHLLTPHFDIRFTGKDVIVARQSGEVLEAAYAALTGHLAYVPLEPKERIVMEWLPSVEALSAATGLRQAAIETTGTIAVSKFHRLMVLSPAATRDGYDWGDTLAHELVHLFVGQKSHDRAPVWLQEGLAKFYQSSWRGPPGRALSRESLKQLREAAAHDRLVPFARMHPSMARLDSQQEASLAFAEVFVLVAQQHRRCGSQAWPRVLDRLAAGRSLESALQQEMHASLAELEQGLKRNARELTAPSLLGAPAAPATMALRFDEPDEHDAEEGSLGAIDDDRVLAPARLAELLMRRGHRAEAIVPLGQAARRSQGQSSVVDARYAALLLETGRTRQARHLLERALRKHPADPSLWRHLGRVAVAQQDWPRARQALTACLQKNPFVPEVHTLLARVYAAEGDTRRAKQATSFAQAAQLPRRPPENKRRPEGDARLRLVSDRWSKVMLDGHQVLATPQWDLALSSGTHTLAPLNDEGGPGGGPTLSVTLAPKEVQLVRLAQPGPTSPLHKAR